ncbi:FecR family protein [Hymenobacter sp. GOD-10R]|uniref:FecR family protein n=1 Tax=Hymenobacter sp. GOD-10R TaxID=3093922 RepID=UPI002D771700|nr:FecR family protein [Hymenobacter sp. GOD-10R]WRQ29340.1 FecR family protein [Hymenobacter sp. GOD-10R]
MPDYVQYTAEDFAQDDFFVRWVLLPDAETEAFWQNWLTTFAFRREEVEAARHLVLALHQLPQQRMAVGEKMMLKQRIFDEIEAREQARPPMVRAMPRVAWQWAAAALLVFGLLGGSWYLWQARQGAPAMAYLQVVKTQTADSLREVANATDDTHLVALSDGSSVLLRPHSRLAFPTRFTGPNRNVYLEGAAFFEVAKNPSRPFFVNTAHLVTKVLGTSFEVQARPAAARVVVTVKTGRVSVYPQSSAEAAAQRQTRKLEGFVLVPNQQATYRLADRKLLRTLLPQPRLQAVQPTFEYTETSLSEVFAQLEKAYGVHIVYDEAVLGNCPLTASFTDEPLFEKLGLICKAVQANYEVMDAQIVVTGPGCK